MCESGNSRKRKFRYESAHEGSKTVKGIFKKDDLDDSLSTSDWGLVIDDSCKSRRRGRCVRLLEEPLNLVCEWDSCLKTFSGYVPYNSHLREHVEQYSSDDVDTVKCCWLDCSYTAHSWVDLHQHVCFHGYHTKLKCIGKNVECRSNLPQCTQTEKFMIPFVPDGYDCEWLYCSEKLSTIYDFVEHTRIHVFHNPKGCKEGEIKCQWKGCTSNAFSSQYKLTEHMRIHTKEKIIACPTCGNLFSNKTKFCDHRKRQLPMNLQSYLCSQCSKFFPSERLLRDHMRLHINHYKCSMCEMTCPKPSILAKHIRYRHLTEKPYKCNQCDYSCVSKHNLDFHLKKHEPEKQFTCNDCEFKCRSSFGLDRHYQKKHGKGWNNVYECHNCKKKFNRGGLLTRHLMKVHNYHWPSGHSRFRYKEDQDGVHRLQTVRYETLDVTEEIIKGKTVQAPSDSEPVKIVLKRQPPAGNIVDRFDVILSKEEEPEPETPKQVVITIDDLDAKGNVLKSQTIQSSEIICTDIEKIATTIKNEIIIDSCFDDNVEPSTSKND